MSATELHLAAFDGDKDRVMRLLSEGVDVHTRTQNDLTPLLLTVIHGNTDTARTLLDAGAGANHGLGVDAAVVLPGAAAAHVEVLDMALHSGSMDTLRLILEAGYSPIVAETLMPVSLLMVASITSANPDAQRLLREYGAKPDAVLDSIEASIVPLPESRELEGIRGGMEARRKELWQKVRENLLAELATEKGV